MIPTVSPDVAKTVILQEGRDTLAYMKESITLFSQRQPVIHSIMFHDIEVVLKKLKDGEDDSVTTELKLKGIVSLIIRCMYAQDEANELEEQWSDQ